MPVTVLKNARLVNEGEIFSADLVINNGRIEKIAAGVSVPAHARVYELDGRWLMPGMIDDQVHFREPGLTRKGDIYHESRAAAAGGITSFMDMPNTDPPTTTAARLAAKRETAARTSLINYAFYLGAANDNLEEIKRLDRTKACGVKIFMGASTGDMLVDDPDVLATIFRHAPGVVAVHCEDTPTILANEETCRRQFGEAVPFEKHPRIRSAEACYKSSALAISLARQFGTQLHVLHISTAAELALFDTAPLTGKNITAEACVHHLFFNDGDYADKGSRIKCNPAIKTEADRKALVAAVTDGRIDVIGTDHAPHTLDEKKRPYFQAPSGLPLAQHALPAVLEHHHRGHFSLPLIAEKTAHAPARRFQIKERGFIREGYWADLVVISACQKACRPSPLFSKCGWSPFAGYDFHFQVDTTFVGGHPACHNGRIDDSRPGCALAFVL